MNSFFKITFGFLTAIIISIALTSCNQNEDLGPTNVDVIDNIEDSTVFQLELIRVLFPAVEVWEERGAAEYRKDSAVIKDRTGEILLSKSFSINVDITKELIVEEQFENLLSVITTSDSIDLTGIKKYVSPWKEIKPKVYNVYNKSAITLDETNQFPSTSIQSVLDYIFLQTRTTQSEFDWNKYLKQAKSIHEFPFQIKVSKVTLRMSGEYMDGRKFKKYIVFEILT